MKYLEISGDEQKIIAKALEWAKVVDGTVTTMPGVELSRLNTDNDGLQYAFLHVDTKAKKRFFDALDEYAELIKAERYRIGHEDDDRYYRVFDNAKTADLIESITIDYILGGTYYD